MTTLIENIRKVMGWCPNVSQSRYKSFQHVDFVNPLQTPSVRSNVEYVQSNNVMFSANTSLLSLCFVICMNLVLFLGSKIDYALLIPILVAMYSLLYFIVARSLQTSISIDENGVHLKSYEFRNITLDYKDIKSITPDKPIKYPIELIGFLAILLTFLVALLAYSVMAYGDWRLIISVAPLLPGYLILKYGQDRKYHNMGAQLSIQAENKNHYTRWYEVTSHYSIRSDERSASEIQAAIKHYRVDK